MSSVRGVVLFPGAGSGANHSSLVAIENALSPTPVMRVDFAYRIAGRRIPDRAPVLITAVRSAVQRAAEQWGCATSDIVIGGRSMGGRMCSMAVAGFDGNERTVQPQQPPLAVAGLVCISYPLHPPKQPTKLRIAHLQHVAVPSLFVSGTRDEFATPTELREHLAVMAVAPSTHWLEDARHDLRDQDAHVAGLIAQWMMSLAK